MERLLSDYREISRCLSELRDSGEKSGLYVDLIELINRIADYVIPKDNPSRERMGGVMGGQILKLRSEELREEGREEGRTLEIYSMVEDGDISPERAAKRLGVAIPVLRERMMESGYQCPEDQEEGIFRVYEACLKRKRGQNGPFPFG